MSIIQHRRKKPSIVITPVRAPTGSVIGRVVAEDGQRIFDRRVNDEMIFRDVHGWPLGARAPRRDHPLGDQSHPISLCQRLI